MPQFVSLRESTGLADVLVAGTAYWWFTGKEMADIMNMDVKTFRNVAMRTNFEGEYHIEKRVFAGNKKWYAIKPRTLGLGLDDGDYMVERLPFTPKEQERLVTSLAELADSFMEDGTLNKRPIRTNVLGALREPIEALFRGTLAEGIFTQSTAHLKVFLHRLVVNAPRKFQLPDSTAASQRKGFSSAEREARGRPRPRTEGDGLPVEASISVGTGFASESPSPMEECKNEGGETQGTSHRCPDSDDEMDVSLSAASASSSTAPMNAMAAISAAATPAPFPPAVTPGQHTPATDDGKRFIHREVCKAQTHSRPGVSMVVRSCFELDARWAHMSGTVSRTCSPISCRASGCWGSLGCPYGIFFERDPWKRTKNRAALDRISTGSRTGVPGSRLNGGNLPLVSPMGLVWRQSPPLSRFRVSGSPAPCLVY